VKNVHHNTSTRCFAIWSDPISRGCSLINKSKKQVNWVPCHSSWSGIYLGFIHHFSLVDNYHECPGLRFLSMAVIFFGTVKSRLSCAFFTRANMRRIAGGLAGVVAFGVVQYA
jgi:hypothetical protein